MCAYCIQTRFFFKRNVAIHRPIINSINILFNINDKLVQHKEEQQHLWKQLQEHQRVSRARGRSHGHCPPLKTVDAPLERQTRDGRTDQTGERLSALYMSTFILMNLQKLIKEEFLFELISLVICIWTFLNSSVPVHLIQAAITNSIFYQFFLLFLKKVMFRISFFFRSACVEGQTVALAQCHGFID